MKGRGILYEELKQKAETYLGREFTQKELRLYPYLVDRALNSQRVERAKLRDGEQEIIELLEKEGRLKREYPSFMHPTRDFWMFMCEILGDSYVELADEFFGGD